MEQLLQFAERAGYPGFFLLMVLQDIFTPLPSELVMASAGLAASKGQLSLPLVMLTCILGGIAGMHFWYVIGRLIGYDRLRQLAERHGRWLTVTPRELDRLQRWFARWGFLIVSFGRALPVVGVLICVPAGIARMPLWQFSLASALFCTVYVGGIVAGTYWVGAQEFSWLERLVGPLVVLGLLGVVCMYVYRVATWRRPDASKDV